MVWKSQDSKLGDGEKKKERMNSFSFLINWAMSEMVLESQVSSLGDKEKSTRKSAHNVTGIH